MPYPHQPPVPPRSLVPPLDDPRSDLDAQRFSERQKRERHQVRPFPSHVTSVSQSAHPHPSPSSIHLFQITSARPLNSVYCSQTILRNPDNQRTQLHTVPTRCSSISASNYSGGSSSNSGNSSRPCSLMHLPTIPHNNNHARSSRSHRVDYFPSLSFYVNVFDISGPSFNVTPHRHKANTTFPHRSNTSTHFNTRTHTIAALSCAHARRHPRST